MSTLIRQRAIISTAWLRMIMMLLTATRQGRSFMPRYSLSAARLSTLQVSDGSSPRRSGRNGAKDDASSGTLEWETFEFSQSPKWDKRFDEQATRALIAPTEEELEAIIVSETEKDAITAETLEKHWTALQSLTPQIVADATRALIPYVSKDRVERMESVLRQRTRNCRFLFENPLNPSNVWACLRTIDSFGIQYVDVVISSGRYQGKAALAQKRGMRTAMGSAQWLTLRNHLSTESAVQSLKSQGYRIVASDVNANSKDIRDIDWEGDDDRPICIVMGNENTGISEEMRALADDTFYIPMYGFAESFNLSVATAITLAHLSACSSSSSSSQEGGKSTGPLRPGDLDEHQINCLRLRGVMNSLAQKKLGKVLLRKVGIELPPELEWA